MAAAGYASCYLMVVMLCLFTFTEGWSSQSRNFVNSTSGCKTIALVTLVVVVVDLDEFLTFAAVGVLEGVGFGDLGYFSLAVAGGIAGADFTFIA